MSRSLLLAAFLLLLLVPTAQGDLLEPCDDPPDTRGDELAFDRVRFAADVAVSGRARLDGGEIVAELTIDGPGGEDGTLRVTGRVFPHTSPLPARGVIGGRRVAVLVPTA